MIDALPSLNRTDATFKTDVDTFFGTELPAFSVQAEAARVQINSNTTTTQQQAALAEAQVPLAQAQTLIATQQAQAAASSALSAGAIVWVTGTTYAIGNLRYSPLNSQVYRRLTTGAGTTDPSLDATNWIIVNGITSENITIPVNNLPVLRPTLNLDFSNNQSVDPRITFTRASIATRTNSKGLIELVPSGVPRIDFDPVTGACKGLLIEEQRTNLLTYSEQFDNAVWVKNEATVTANAATSPDGATTADKLIETATTAVHFLNCIGVAVSVIGTQYTRSTYVKASERSAIHLHISAGPFGAGQIAYFDLITKNVTVLSGTPTGSIQDVGGGWFRCSMTTPAATIAASFDSQTRLGNGTVEPNYSGLAGYGLFICGAQLEAGAFPTSYIPTVASQVTRAADVATMTGANFSSWYQQDEGSFVASYMTPVRTNDNNTLFAVVEAGVSNALSARMGFSGTRKLRAFAQTAGGGFEYTLDGATNTSETGTIALAYKSKNDFSFSSSGATVLQDTTGDLSAQNPKNRLVIGDIFNSALNGHIRSLSYYPKRCSNAELQALSTQ